MSISQIREGSSTRAANGVGILRQPRIAVIGAGCALCVAAVRRCPADGPAIDRAKRLSTARQTMSSAGSP